METLTKTEVPALLSQETKELSPQEYDEQRLLPANLDALAPAVREYVTHTDDEVNFPDGLPQYMLDSRLEGWETHVEVKEREISNHSENIVFSTELIEFADKLLNGSTSFTHNEVSAKNGVEHFKPGSFNIVRTDKSETEQEYTIKMIKMGHDSPFQTEYVVRIKDGNIWVRTFHENSPAALEKAKLTRSKPQNLGTRVQWNSDRLRDTRANEFYVTSREEFVKNELASGLRFMELHSENEVAEQERMKAKQAKKMSGNVLTRLMKRQ